MLKPKSKKVGTKRKPTAASVFAAEEEEEEERPARRLVPIEYTPEELAAATREPDPAPAPTTAAGDASASERAKSAAAAIEANIRRVAAEAKADADASAPAPAQTKEAIFSREVNWSAYSDPVGGARAATASWTRRRVAELLGEEEPALVELVLEKTDERLSADAMVEALEPMLDAEAEPFVLDLWRVILKETRGGDA